MIDLNELIIQNEPLIYSIINRYKEYFDIEDLYQTAAMINKPNSHHMPIST